METEKAAERDWSSLSPELLNLIAKKLSEVSDFIRFRAVCTAWRFSTPITDLPPQFPWIIEEQSNPYEPHMNFYSTNSSKMYTFHDPRYLDQRFFGSSQGYMLSEFCDWTTNKRLTSYDNIVHTYQFSLFNPLNNHEITLPPCDLGLYSCSYWIGPQKYQIGEYVVRSGYFNHGGYQLAFCCLGQDNWCKFNSENYYDGCPDFGCFHIKGMVFMVEDDTGVTNVFDLTTGNLAYVLPPVVDTKNYYLVDASGDILIVFQCFDASDDSHNYWFNVYRLDFSGSSSPHWVKVKNIGNHALFIDLDGGFALEANDFAGIKANCIYYIEQSWVKRIDIETGDHKLLQCPFKKPERWFVPNLGHL